MCVALKYIVEATFTIWTSLDVVLVEAAANEKCAQLVVVTPKLENRKSCNADASEYNAVR